jgi:hypothetical protein
MRLLVCLINHYAKNTYGEADVWLHTLTSALFHSRYFATEEATGKEVKWGPVWTLW